MATESAGRVLRSVPVVFLDANVLYSACCRDLLIELSLQGACHCRWSDGVLGELRGALKRNHPGLRTSDLDRLCGLMDRACPEAKLKFRSAKHLSPLPMRDAADMHVVQSAYEACADLILTFNLKHFPSMALQPFDLSVEHPDLWLYRQAEREPVRVAQTFEKCRSRLTRPRLTLAKHLSHLRSAGLPRLASILSNHSP